MNQAEQVDHSVQPTETDLIRFSKTEKGQQAMNDFKEWKNQDGKK